MTSVTKGTVKVDKSYLRKERDQLYGDWTMAFWRELFQNSVDAGSKRVSITISEKPRRATMGNVLDESAAETVTNVVFADDGKGMTAEIIDDVYFKMGQSTKEDGGGSIGGFGRARIMTCFAQERYSVLTRDRYVSGDGIDFEHGSLEGQIELLKQYAEKAAESGDEASQEAINADIAMLSATIEAGGFAGCRVEVDLDNTQPHSWRSRPGTSENMKKALRDYLSESQLPCDIEINGLTPEAYFEYEGGKLQARKGPARRTLTIHENEGWNSFATVHTSEGKKAGHKGAMIIRVSGASMYKTEIDGLEAQVIVELDPTQSRDILNSNRDGMKHPYGAIVNSLVGELTRETLTALKDKSGKSEEYAGEKGKLKASATNLSKVVEKEISAGEFEKTHAAVEAMPRVNSYDALRGIGISQDIVKVLIQQTYNGEGFLYAYANSIAIEKSDDLSRQIVALKEGLYAERRNVEWFLANAPEKAKAWVLACLAERIKIAEEEQRGESNAKIEGVNDVHVRIESANEKTRAAARRHSPDKWDVTTGRGKSAKSLLAVWTAACAVSMETIFKLRPKLDPVTWTTGFVYSLPEETYQGDVHRMLATEACCVKLGAGENDYRLLINPVTEDGSLKYSLSDRKDLRRILALAFHEVAHVLTEYHDERFAAVMTDITAEVDWDEAFKRMRTACAAVVAAYTDGKIRMQKLDNTPGPRPAERLLAIFTGNDVEMASDIMRTAEETGELDLERFVVALDDEETHEERQAATSRLSW